MPLYVGEIQVKTTPDCIKEFHRAHEILKAATERLYEEDYVSTAGERLVYVCQREYAILPPDHDELDIIGSEDATTCHLVVIRHTGSNVCGLGHLDGLKTAEFLQKITSDVLDLSTGAPEGRLEVDVVGGFIDDRQESVKLSKEILEVLISESHDYHLRTLFCTDLNDTVRDEIHYPIIYGVGVNVKTGHIFPSKFPERGPDMDIRGCLCFAGYREIHNVYDSKERCLVVGPYSWEPQEDAVRYAQLPNHVIRKYLSTSPEQEPPYFEEHVRTAFMTIHKHPYPHLTLFKDNAPRRYKRQAGKWTRIDEET